MLLLRETWRMWAVLLFAALSLCVTFTIRVVEASDSRVGDQALDLMKLGIYADIDTTVAMQYRPLNAYADAPEERWSVKIDPGADVEMRATLVLMNAAPYFEIDIDRPLTIVAILPNGARWGSMESDLMPNGMNCASWFDGDDVHVAHPVFHEVSDGTVALTCDVPAVGKMQQVAFDLRARFHDAARERVGIGRVQSGLRLEASWMPDSELSGEGHTYTLRQPMEVELSLPASVNLAQSFPEPTGGGAGGRSWRVGTALGSPGQTENEVEDISYRLEDPHQRVWIQPAVDFSLLLAGLMLGLLPSLARRPDPRKAPTE